MWQILIVEDDLTNAAILEGILKSKAVLDLATNGKEAFEKIKKSEKANNPYDLILLDFLMPDVDGLEFLKILRNHEEKRKVQLGKGVPVIFVTAHPEPFMKSFQNGADDYILKPIEASTLFQKIKNLLKNK